MAGGTPDILLPFNPMRASVTYERNTLSFPSSWSGSDQRLRRFGRWKIVYRWENLEPDDFDEIFPLFEDFGTERTFSIYNVKRTLPRGNASVGQLANLKVAGANQVGKSLAVDGAPNSTLLFRRGDFIGLGLTKQAFRVKADCTSNGLGQATIALCQYIGASPADNEDVIVSYVPITVSLDKDPTEDSGPPEVVNFEVAMTEALP